MINRLCVDANIATINVVRRQGHVEELRKLGFNTIVNTEESDWQEKLEAVVKSQKNKPFICFECVAGELAGQVLSKMPSNSTMYLYGQLSRQHVAEVNTLLLIGRNQSIEGFFLGNYLQSLSLWRLSRLLKKCTA